MAVGESGLNCQLSRKIVDTLGKALIWNKESSSVPSQEGNSSFVVSNLGNVIMTSLNEHTRRS